MRYFLDTEFNGFGGKLMSIALAPREDGYTPFYRVVEMEDPVDSWVATHVVPFLSLAPVPTNDAAMDLATYLRADPHPIIVADWPTDFSLLLELLITGPGEMEAVPDFVMEFCNLKGFNTANHSATPHNALSDARALRAHCIQRFGY